MNAVTLRDQQQFRLNKISEIKGYFVAEIKERELVSKRLSKYIPSFDYFDKSLIVLSIATGRVSAASFTILVGIVSVSFSLAFSISIGIVKKLLKPTKKEKEKA